MKVRRGFVSNSSSSSFIIAFKTPPSSAEEVHSALFPNGPTEISLDYIEYRLSSQEVALRVFNDIKRRDAEITPEIDPDEDLHPREKPSITRAQKVFRLARHGHVEHPRQIAAREAFDQAIESPVLANGLFDELSASQNMWDPPGEETTKNWKSRWRKKQSNYEKWLKVHVKEFISKIRGYALYKVRYSDNGTGEALLEHGDIFRNIPHIRISEH